MLRKRESALSRIMNIIQALLSVLVFLITDYLYPVIQIPPSVKILICVQIAVLWYFLLHKTGMGVIHRTSSIERYVQGYIFVVIFGCGIISIEVLFVHFSDFREFFKFVITYAVFDYTQLLLFKLLMYLGMSKLRSNGFNSRNYVIVANSQSKVFVDTFLSHKDWGYQLHSIVSYDVILAKHYPATVLLNTTEKLIHYLQAHPVDDVFYCLPVNQIPYDINELLDHAKEVGINLHILQSIQAQQKSLFQRSDPEMEFSFTSHPGVISNYASIKFKYVLEVILSAIIMLLSLPFTLPLMLLIKLEDGGPVFFKQERIGLNGRRFMCYKFRSMIVNAEAKLPELEHLNESDGPAFKIKDDPRITCIGKFIRKTSLDEFPQFYNVIKGEMALVGPRPPLLKEVQKYSNAQLRRLSVKPGITCTWQVSGRNEVSFDEWMKMDLDYIDHWSLKTDFKIIVSTVGVVLKANGR